MNTHHPRKGYWEIARAQLSSRGAARCAPDPYDVRRLGPFALLGAGLASARRQLQARSVRKATTRMVLHGALNRRCRRTARRVGLARRANGPDYPLYT